MSPRLWSPASVTVQDSGSRIGTVITIELSEQYWEATEPDYGPDDAYHYNGPVVFINGVGHHLQAYPASVDEDSDVVECRFAEHEELIMPGLQAMNEGAHEMTLIQGEPCFVTLVPFTQ